MSPKRLGFWVTFIITVIKKDTFNFLVSHDRNQHKGVVSELPEIWSGTGIGSKKANRAFWVDQPIFVKSDDLALSISEKVELVLTAMENRRTEVVRNYISSCWWVLF